MSSLVFSTTYADGNALTAAQLNGTQSDVANYINNRNSGSSSWDAVSASSATNVPLTINNSSGTQDIARFQDNGTNVFLIEDGGYITAAQNSAFRAYGTGQVIGTGIGTKLQFGTEVFDTRSEYDATTNYRFTATKSGKYLLNLNVAINPASPNNAWTIYFKKNGGAYAIANSSAVSSFLVTGQTLESLSFTDLISLSAGDYIEAFVDQITSGNITTNVAVFSGYKVA